MAATPEPAAERWAKVKELFATAAELPPGERAAFLDGAAGADAAARREVERLLAADGEAEGLLDAPAWGAGEAAGLLAGVVGGEAMSGRWIGPYRVEREIGHGGMGAVYLAVRADGQYEKRVAVKLVRHGLDTEDLLARFHLERHILGRLEHPGIARLYDAGATADGRPYFVMEHVPGEPIDRWCERRGLTVAARLELFREVCAAVHYAHQNLVAHRDLKPSNILVDESGRPRLLDFGIAKLLGPESAAAPETRTLLQAMTPEYASPEQVRGEPVTTASDVYSLGVLLYQLLAGRRPYELAGLPPREVERLVAEVEPERPSRAAASERLTRSLAGDLDNIVARAMHKEPARRYASVDQLAEDVRRHLAGLPVVARGDGFWYRAGKLVRRHKVAAAFVALAAGSSVALAALSVTTARALSRAETALARADREARKAGEVTNFLVDLFNVSDPFEEGGGETVTASEILRQGAARVEVELAAEPETRGALLDAIGKVYLNLGLPAEAEPLLERALAARRQALGPRHPDVATSLDHLAEAARERGDFRRAQPLATEALALRRAHLGESHPDVAVSLTTLGRVLYRAGDYEAAEPPLREALAIRRRLPGDTRVLVADSASNLAVVLQVKGDYTGAEPLFREAIATYRELFGPEHPSLAISLNNLAMLLSRKGELAEAEPLLREALELHRRRLGGDHPLIAADLGNLANVLVKREDFASAEPLAREALALRRRRLGERHPTVAQSVNTLAGLLHAKGDAASAEPLFREAVRLRREILPAGHPDLATSLVGLGAVLVDLGRFRAAEPLLREALSIRRDSLPAGHWRIAVAQSELGGCLAVLGSGTAPEAEALLTESYPVLEAELGRDNRETRRARAHREALERVGAGGR